MSSRTIPMAAAAGLTDPQQRRWAISSVLGGMLLVVLDAAIAPIALPSIAEALGLTPASALRVVTAYQLGLILMLLPAAALGESYGYRRVFVAGAALFSAASALGALSPSLSWLVAARFAQGLGGAGIMSLGIALLRFVVPAQQLGAAIGWNAMTVALSAAAGPTIGALLLSWSSWPWVFALNLPIGAAVITAARALPDTKGAGPPPKLLSAAISMAMFASLIIGAGSLLSKPSLAFALLGLAALMATALLRRESHRAAPLIPLDLLSLSSFRVAVLASALCFIGQTAALLALPFHLAKAQGLTPLATAAYLLPWPLAVALAGPWAGKLADRIDTALLGLAGGLLLSLGLGAASLAASDGPALAISPCVMLCGLGFGLFNVSNNRFMFLSVPRERSGAAGALQSLTRLTGQSLGALGMSLLYEKLPSNSAPPVALALAAILTLAAGLICVLRLGKANL